MNDATIVYRQIHPSFVQAGFPTSQAFRPTPNVGGFIKHLDSIAHLGHSQPTSHF